MAVPVLINRGGGTASRQGERLGRAVEDAFAGTGLAIDLRLFDGSEIAAAVRSHLGQPLIVVGGGDSTLGGAAEVLAGSDTALGILPLGTRDHLARELGLPLDLDGAARLIAAPTIRRIDVGRVNGRCFVNNASIGLYPALVRRRDEHPAPKWLAAIPAAAASLRRLRHHRLRLDIAGEQQRVVTPMLFVGNNRYVLDRGALGTREALDDGKLSVYAVASRDRLALIGFALRTIAGRADPERDFAAIGDTPEFTVGGISRRIEVALDGEVVRLAMPLCFTSDAGALAVVAPLSPPNASPRSRS